MPEPGDLHELKSNLPAVNRNAAQTHNSKYGLWVIHSPLYFGNG